MQPISFHPRHLHCRLLFSKAVSMESTDGDRSPSPLPRLQLKLEHSVSVCVLFYVNKCSGVDDCSICMWMWVFICGRAVLPVIISDYTYVIACSLIRTNMLCACAWRAEGDTLAVGAVAGVSERISMWDAQFWLILIIYFFEGVCACMHFCEHVSFVCLYGLVRMHNGVFCSAGCAGVRLCSGCTWPQLRWEVCVFHVSCSVLPQIWVKG